MRLVSLATFALLASAAIPAGAQTAAIYGAGLEAWTGCWSAEQTLTPAGAARLVCILPTANANVANVATIDSGVAPSWPPPAAPTPPIHVEGVVHRYGDDVLALAGVDLRIEPGQRVAIVGRNGSGKTTLAKHLNGLLRPASGRVVIGGNDIASEPVHRLAATVGFVIP